MVLQVAKGVMQTLVLGQIKVKQPRSAQSRRLESGFTLLEMMFVILIIGISLGLITPHFMKNEEDVLKDESVRIVSLMEYASDAASSQGHWLAWIPTNGGYRFLQLDENKNIWQPITSDDVLRERKLPEGMTIAAANNKQTALSINSMITLSPSGIQSPFQIEIAIAKTRRIIKGNILGKAEILNPNLAITPAF